MAKTMTIKYTFEVILISIVVFSLLSSKAFGLQVSFTHSQPKRSAVQSAASSEVATSQQSAGTDGGGKKKRVSVLVCPAQFCVPDDYNVLFENLAKIEDDSMPEIGTCKVAPLPRTEWIKVARQLPTRNFLEAKLPVHLTLGWYFDAVEQALADILAEEGPDASVCIVGHSIGGWVARAYLGGLGK
jgi:hypothetical protein